MVRSRPERQRYLEGVVGDLGRVEVLHPGQHDGEGWLYIIRCRSCWATEPAHQRRGHQQLGKMRLQSNSTAEAAAAWLEHEAAYHVTTEERTDG